MSISKTQQAFLFGVGLSTTLITTMYLLHNIIFNNIQLLNTFFGIFITTGIILMMYTYPTGKNNETTNTNS